LEVMAYKCFDNLHLSRTWTTRILHHPDFFYQQWPSISSLNNLAPKSS
jgi:hypothetical protein